MKPLYLEPSKEKPEIHLDKDKGIFLFSGKSIPYDAFDFYKPIIEWFEAYSLEPNPLTTVDFQLEYFNTASSKLLMQVFFVLNRMHNEGNKVVVNWRYQEDDDDMRESGEEMASALNIPFNYDTVG